jgi:manganese transport protein
MMMFKRFVGPAMLVAVGYMDPGNWATDLAGGSRFEYTLLSVILISNIFAIFLQHTSIRLGIGTGLDLAQACRAFLPRWANFILWILCEIAIIAMDLAEVLGTAIALNLLFGIPLVYGVAITILDVILVLFLFEKNFKVIEIIISSLIFLVIGCFMVELFLSKPQIASIMAGFVPTKEIIQNGEMRWIAIGILGATVMPHNLYLHSYLVKKLNKSDNRGYEILDNTKSTISSLSLAFFVNAGILILAASAFYKNGQTNVSEIEVAYKILDPILGVDFASLLFAIALLACGQNATITGTLAGQAVMEGFLDLKIPTWVRGMITRGLAIIPAWLLLYYAGDSSTTDLLIWSQVILSLQLGFAIVPLIYFTSNSVIMTQEFVNPKWLKWTLVSIASIIIGFNITILFNIF